MTRRELIYDIERYCPFNEQEEKDKALILNWIKTNDNAFSRENAVAHMTASAWVVNKDRSKVLMVYHNIYHSWSWLGGHADGETDLLSVAIREVKEEAALYDGSLVRGYAVVTGDTTFYDRAVAKRDCYICGGEIKENAIISGKAFIDTVGVNAPVIGGESHVYGEVRGNIYIKGDIFPWDIFNNHTKDMFLYENGKWSAFSVPEKLKPPQSYQKRQTKKKNQPER